MHSCIFGLQLWLLRLSLKHFPWTQCTLRCHRHCAHRSRVARTACVPAAATAADTAATAWRQGWRPFLSVSIFIGMSWHYHMMTIFYIIFFSLPRDSQGFDKCCFQTCSVLTNMFVNWSYGSNDGYGVGLIRHGKLSSMKHHIHTHPASPSHHLAKTYATSTLGIFLVSFQTRFGDVGNGYQRQHLHVQGRRQRILEQLRMKPRRRKRQRAQRPHKTSKETWLIPSC